MVLFQETIFFLSAKFGHCSMCESKKELRMCCTTRDAILEVRSDRYFGGVPYRNSHYIHQIYISELIKVSVEYLLHFSHSIVG